VTNSLKSEVARRTCQGCAAGHEFGNGYHAYHDSGPGATHQYRCTANTALAEWVVEQVEAAYQRGVSDGIESTVRGRTSNE